ncbi:MAG TPA: zf-HC2 domain-containing protein [Pyrinomonadaceae bacterium]|nr:zf-HC2 domain-containing protein [Pyrinomonadaceae bacterium]
MSKCQDIRGRMTLFLDDELAGSERAGFERHLSQCESCRSRLESERRFLETIRHARPLHSASEELRARVESLLSTAESDPVDSTRLSPLQGPAPGRTHASTFTFGPRSLLGIAAILVLILLLGIWTITHERKRLLVGGPSEFALMAANTHLRHIRGQLPLEVTSVAPDEISAWFHDKLAFSVKLPNYQESSGQKKLYDLEGARLVGFKSDYAAYVAYQMQQRPISLVITSNQVAQPSGGEEISAKGLTFHYDSINGFKVITWSDRGLTYALISDFDERGQQSCVVCHHGSKDQDFIEPLRPRS